MSDLFRIASSWESESITAEDRNTLKKCIEELVGYPCRLACKENDGSIDIYVFSEEEGKVTDWLELQSTGALGVIFESYDDPDNDAVDELDGACEEYNETRELTFVEDESDN